MSAAVSASGYAPRGRCNRHLTAADPNPEPTPTTPKASRNMSDWRIVQLFLPAKRLAVYEVQEHSRTGDLRCTCPWDDGGHTCRHVKYVRSRKTRNGSTQMLPMFATDGELAFDEAVRDSSHYRQFVIHNSDIVVL